tara:strand:- start:166 stop:693 length:528 start_codon:yes stop_codon:yes gene_type:complete
MKIISKLNDLIILKTNYYFDDRGYFTEEFNSKNFNLSIKKKINFIQDNVSFSKKNVFRGLHYQIAPFQQNKLIKVIRGEILDFVLDINKKSKTYGKLFNFRLSSKNKHQLFIPSGYAHGFYVLSQTALIRYKVDKPYSPKHEQGINILSKKFEIDKLIKRKNIIISDKDKMYNPF